MPVLFRAVWASLGEQRYRFLPQRRFGERPGKLRGEQFHVCIGNAFIPGANQPNAFAIEE
jgi:hypothetical protein